MHSADYAVARCLSVSCHTPVFCLNGYTYTQRFFHRRVAPPFWFFHTKLDGNIPTGTQRRRGGGSNANGMKKITIFDQYRFNSQMMQELLCCKMMQEFHSYYARRIRNHNIIYQPSWWSASMSIAIHHAQHDCFYQSVVWHTTYMAK